MRPAYLPYPLHFYPFHGALAASIMVDANMNAWDIPRVIEALGPRMAGMHLHDNDGTGDAHLPMGRGNIDWNRCFGAMRGLKDECIFIMEYAAGTPLTELERGRELLEKNLG